MELTSVFIPDKVYFSIGDVARIVGVKPYVLRYWESQFAVLHPEKSPNQRRLYRRKDVEKVLLIKHLLYDLKYSIEGARQHLQSLRRRGPEVANQHLKDAFDSRASECLEEAKQELRSLLRLCKAN